MPASPRPPRRLAAASLALAVTLGLLASGCGPPPRPARFTAEEPPTPEELEAETSLKGASCSPSWSFAFPGAGHLCLGDTATGATLAGLGVAELGGGIAAAATLGAENPASALPIGGFSFLWIAGWGDTTLEGQRARRLRYVPRESLGELALAPWNPQVLRRPDVWIGVGLTAATLTALVLVTNHQDDAAVEPSGPRNLFGAEVDPELAYPAAGASFAALFTHVAVAEEVLFRGLVQSNLARGCGHLCGWALGSLIFGAAHIPNALALEGATPEETREMRRDYVLYAVPFITAVGSYIGASYYWNDYSLGPPVALHFWYDFLLSAASFAIDPDDHPLAARIALPW